MIAAVSDSFDDIRAPQMRFLEAAARLGELHVYLWSDAVAARASGKPPKFPEAERKYFLEAVRYVAQVTMVEAMPDKDALLEAGRPDVVAALAGDFARLAAPAVCAHVALRIRRLLAATSLLERAARRHRREQAGQART